MSGWEPAGSLFMVNLTIMFARLVTPLIGIIHQYGGKHPQIKSRIV